MMPLTRQQIGTMQRLTNQGRYRDKNVVSGQLDIAGSSPGEHRISLAGARNHGALLFVAEYGRWLLRRARLGYRLNSTSVNVPRLQVFGQRQQGYYLQSAKAF
ncbi:hypothetical protein LAD77_00795 [Klebsiella pneumoniae]|nr:hypothetical protein [Klebsiella pneumoniae]